MKKLSIWVTVMFAIIILMMNCFFGWLIYSDYQHNYEQAQSQYFELISGQFANNIGEGLKYGKTLERFYGMDTIFDQMYAYIPEGISIYILNNSLETVYASNGGATLPASALSNPALLIQTGAVNHTTPDGTSVMFQPIFEESGRSGGLMLVIPKGIYTNMAKARLPQFMSAAILVSAIAWVIIFGIYFVRKKSSDANRRFALRLMMIVAIVSLLAQGATAYFTMQAQYRAIMEECSANICRYFASVIEFVNEKGVPYVEMEGVSEFLASRLENVPMLWNVQIDKVLADSGPALGRTSQSANTVLLVVDKSAMVLRFELSETYIASAMLNLFLTFFITVAVAFVILVEVSRLPEIYVAQQTEHIGEGGASALLRLAAFLIFTGNYMCIPYTASVIRQANTALFGFSLSMTASLPVTAEAFGMMLGLTLVSQLAFNMKTRKILLIAVLLLVVGNILCAVVNTALLLILLRLLCGMGSALISHSLQRLATGDGEDIHANLGAINAGLLAGITCGGSLGAIVSGMIGTHATFLGGVLFAVAFYALMRLLMGEKKLCSTGGRRVGGVGRLLKSGRVWLYIICAIIPLNIGIMFMVSFFPAYMSAMGQSSLAVSYGYLVNGLAGIYIGPLLLKTLSKRLGTRKSLACMMGAAAIAVLLLSLDTVLVAAAMCASAIMGIFDEFGGPATNGGILKLADSLGVQPVNALAFSSIVGNVAQMMSPVLYSLLIVGLKRATQGGGSYQLLLPITVVVLINGIIILLTMRHLDSGANIKGLSEGENTE